MLDIHNFFEPRVAIIPNRVSDNTAQVGPIIDLANDTAVEFIIAAGSIVSGTATFTLQVEESNASNFSGSNVVTDEFLYGTKAGASLTFTDDNVAKKVGYNGIKRYVRLTLTPASNAAAADICGIALLRSRKQPK